MTHVAVQQSFVLRLSCEDRPGIVAAVTSRLAELGTNITGSSQYWDKTSNRFFMRIAFSAAFTSVDGIEDGLGRWSNALRWRQRCSIAGSGRKW
jgi:formyltetrahydrofolate deformylase